MLYIDPKNNLLTQAYEKKKKEKKIEREKKKLFRFKQKFEKCSVDLSTINEFVCSIWG